MEMKTRTIANKKEPFQKGIYHYTYKIKNGEKVKFFGNNEVRNEFNIHHYGDSGTLYYRK